MLGVESGAFGRIPSAAHMHSEATIEDVCCPTCGSGDECPHLLAVIDRTFNEVQGGYCFDRDHEFQDAIEGTFKKTLERGRHKKSVRRDSEIGELWSYAIENYAPGDGEVPIDADCLTGLVIRYLNDAGGEEFQAVDDPGVPGESSAISLIYARSPHKVFTKAISRLREDLVRFSEAKADRAKTHASKKRTLTERAPKK